MSVRPFGFLLGLVLCAVVLALPTFSVFTETARELVESRGGTVAPADLARSMQVVLAVGLLMVTWWITEPIPLFATALLPAVAFPLFQVLGMQQGSAYPFTLKNTLANYANPVVYLFLGGFLLAAAMQKWQLDRRFTLWLLTRGRLADNSRSVLLAVMAAAAFLSMWMSNTATTALMLPLGYGILATMNMKPGESRFGTALMLGVAWSASIGGMATIIGSPTNAVGLGILHTALADTPGFARVTFVDWMGIGVPIVVLLVPLCWWLLLRFFPPEVSRIEGGKERLLAEARTLGPMNRGAKRTILLLAGAAAAWVLLPSGAYILPAGIWERIAWIDEYAVGLIAGFLLFVVPSDLRRAEFLLDWSDTRFVEWGVLLLFGGGIALSDALFRTGLAEWIATSFVQLFGSSSTVVMMAVVSLLAVAMTELMSNTAVVTMLAPIIISVGRGTDTDPVLLTIAATLAASLAFMLPVSTPPNALVYGTGYVRLRDMMRGGIVLDLVSWPLVVMMVTLVAGMVLGLGWHLP